MKILRKCIETCRDCDHCSIYSKGVDGSIDSVAICEFEKNNPRILIKSDAPVKYLPIPDWCKLEDPPRKFINEVDPTGVVLQNGLLWSKENLEGYGGVCCKGQWYYSWELVQKALTEIGDGWRLPTLQEIVSLFESEESVVLCTDPVTPNFYEVGSLQFECAGYLDGCNECTLVGMDLFGLIWTSHDLGQSAGVVDFSKRSVISLSKLMYCPVRLVHDVE